ncbi:MAG: glycosyltransferase family 2 protein [Anaerolineae bacterium]
MKINLAILIVNWNVRDMLAACLHSVEADLAASNLTGRIWVVDNASSDGSVGMLRQDFPQVCLIASEKNLGFAGGNNAALRAMGFGPNPSPAKGAQSERGGEILSLSEAERGLGGEVNLPEAVLLLNPDTKVHPGALSVLSDFLARIPQAGMAGARLVYGDGSFQHSAFGFPGLWQLAIELLPLPGRLTESRLNGRYPRSAYESSQPFRVGHPLGAAMCVRREAIQQVGLLDERYHMYVEEVDWSKRMAAAGWEVYCVPAAAITHYGGQSTGQIHLASFINLWSSRYRFYRRYYHPLKVRLAAHIVRLGMKRKAKFDTQARQQGELSQADWSARLSGYEEIIKIWQG